MFVESTTCVKIETARRSVTSTLSSLTNSTLVEVNMALSKITSVCPVCSTPFYRKSHPEQRFCSRRCSSFFNREAISKGVKNACAAKRRPPVKCRICKQSFYRPLNLANAFKGTCSKQCAVIRNFEIRTKRFWSQVAITANPDKCWLWVGKSVTKGYGTFHLLIEGKKESRAPRVSYYLFYKIAPKELQALHRCDTPLCCNPHHLFLGTHQENMLDRTNKGRNQDGEKSPNSKLTIEQVLKIRELYVPKQYTSYRLAKEFNTCQQNIIDIIHRKCWKHI